MHKTTKFLITYSALLVIIILFAFDVALVAPTQTHAETGYTVLAPIPGFSENSKINSGSLGPYLNSVFKMGIALASGLAVLMIVMGGIQYVSSDAWSKKSEGKERIIAAVLGLLIALGSYVLLNTINPDLLNTEIKLEGVTLSRIDTPVVPSYVTDPEQITLDGTDGIGGVGYVPDGTPYNPNLTAYSPQASFDKLEGGYASSKPGLDGKFLVRTLDDVAENKSSYVTLAGDPSQYGRTVIIPSITYKDKYGSVKTLTNVTGYIHDTGSAFEGAGYSHYDVAIGRDYTQTTINSQPFTGGNTSIVGATKK